MATRLRGPLFLSLVLAFAAYAAARSALGRRPVPGGPPGAGKDAPAGEVGGAPARAATGERIPREAAREGEERARLEAELSALRARSAALEGDLQASAARRIEPPASRGEAGVPAAGGAEDTPFRGPRDAAEVAELLGLDASRRDLLQAEAGRMLQRMRAMQAERAVEERTDGKLVRRLPALGAELEPLKTEWRRWIEGTLSAGELQRYDRFRWDQVFFRYAQSPRRQEIERLPDGERVVETEEPPTGGVFTIR